MAGNAVLVINNVDKRGGDNGPRYDLNRIPMPELVKGVLDKAGKIAAAKLLNLIESKDFDDLPIERQVYLIELVFRRAYGAPAQSPKDPLPPAPTSEANLRLTDKLRELSKAAHFPEMKQVDPTTMAQSDSKPKE